MTAIKLREYRLQAIEGLHRAFDGEQRPTTAARPTGPQWCSRPARARRTSSPIRASGGRSSGIGGAEVQGRPVENRTLGTGWAETAKYEARRALGYAVATRRDGTDIDLDYSGPIEGAVAEAAPLLHGGRQLHRGNLRGGEVSIGTVTKRSHLPDPELVLSKRQTLWKGRDLVIEYGPKAILENSENVAIMAGLVVEHGQYTADVIMDQARRQAVRTYHFLGFDPEA